MNNTLVRDAIRRSRFKHYEIAQQLGIHETVLSRWLRNELTSERQEKILKAVHDLEDSAQ